MKTHINQHSEMSILIPMSLALSDEDQTNYNSQFMKHELEFALNSLKNTTPGHDYVHNQMLKNLSGDYKESVLEIINQSYMTGEVLDSWKLTIILPIHKQDKPKNEIASYRPISLLPCFAKLIEKLVCMRLTYVLESSNSLSKSQYGYRKRLCTMDQLAKYEQVIRHTLCNKMVCISIFIDLSSAYDTVWHSGLIFKLSQLGIKGVLLRWIKEYLKNRKFKIFLEGKHSLEQTIISGVPQGSILSPTLFNVMMSDIPCIDDVNMSEYADDLLIYCSGNSIDHVKEKIQLQVTSIQNWAKLWGFKINIGKTKAMVHTLKTYNNPIIQLDEIPIKFVSKKKYLGLIIDSPRLTWKHHIDYLITKCIPSINVMKSFANHAWGADRKILLNYYKAVIRSKLDYGCQFYSTASSTQIKLLDKIQNTCLRIALGVWKTSPISSMEIESNIPPLKIQREYITMKYYYRIAELPMNIPSNPSFIYRFL